MNYYIYGKHSVTSALLNKKRIIHKIIVSNQENYLYIKELLANHSYLSSLSKKLVIDNINNINKLLGTTVTHQGFVISTANLPQPSIEEIIEQANDKSTIVILDQANDSGNIGAILRSCAAFNIDALIIPKDNSPNENGAIAKAATGALENIPFLQVTNIKSAIDLLKSYNYWVAGLTGASEQNLNTALNFNRLVLVFGNEHKGLRSLTEKSCDLLVKIPFNANKVESLNLSNAVAISLFSRFNQ